MLSYSCQYRENSRKCWMNNNLKRQYNFIDLLSFTVNWLFRVDYLCVQMMAFSFKTAGPFDYNLSVHFFLLLGLLFTAVFSVPHQQRDDRWVKRTHVTLLLFKFVFISLVFFFVLILSNRTKLNAATFYYDTFNHSSFDTFDEQQVRRFDELETSSAAVHLNNQIADGNVTTLSETLNAAQHLTFNASTPTDNITVSMMIISADDTVCYKDLGCINRFSFADPILWPINLLPHPRSQIDTHFTLNTREQSTPPVKNKFDFLIISFLVVVSFSSRAY